MDDLTGLNLPVINSWEELSDLVNNTKNASKSPKKTNSQAKKKANSNKSKSRQPIVGDLQDKETTLRPSVFSASHFYVREGSTLDAARLSAKDERKFRNSNVAVFLHDHCFGAACVPTCMELLKESDSENVS